MIPGFAQSREQLPWLYYPESDRVIINAHNFTPPSGPVGIGGEVAWWCPSLDDAGNGGSTLNDLIGSNDITLTNMESGDWIADTGSGGVRALDFDGSNDYGAAGTSATFSPSPFSLSFWMKCNATPAAFDGVLGRMSSSAWTDGWGVFWVNSTQLRFWVNQYNTRYAAVTVALPTAWNHICCTWETGVAPKIYLNTAAGSSSGTAPTSQTGTTTPFEIGRHQPNINLNGRLDDIRIFDKVVSGGEMTSLASARGYQP